MPAMKYRTIRTPPITGSITLEDAMNAAQVNGRVKSKKIAGAKITHSPKTSSGAVGKRAASTRAKSARKSVAGKR
jgi:hypothetical protein